MRVFVLGGTGAIGGHLIPALVAEGHTVTALARTPGKAAALTAQGATAVSVSIFDRSALAAVFAGLDAVANLTSAIPPMTRFLRASAWLERAVGPACWPAPRRSLASQVTISGWREHPRHRQTTDPCHEGTRLTAQGIAMVFNSSNPPKPAGGKSTRRTGSPRSEPAPPSATANASSITTSTPEEAFAQLYEGMSCGGQQGSQRDRRVSVPIGTLTLRILRIVPQ